MAKVDGFPPGLAKNMDKLPASNPHKKAYVAQQEAEQLRAENEQLKEQQLQTAQGLLGILGQLVEGGQAPGDVPQDPDVQVTALEQMMAAQMQAVA